MPTTGFQRTLATLARTPNRTAVEVLAQGITGPSPAVRSGAIAALARRSDEASQRKLLEYFEWFTNDEVAALGDLSRNLRTTLRKMLAEHSDESSRWACQFITRCRAFDEFPGMVSAAMDPSHPAADAMASTVLDLARALHDEIAAYRRAPAGRDPSFARRWALTSLGKAVDRFRDHHRVELIEAFLLITTPGNHTLTHLLSDPGHPAHQPMLTMLQTSQSIGAIEVLAKVFDDAEAPLSLLEIAAERTDVEFRRVFLESLGYPASPRVLANVGRINKLQWLDTPLDDLIQLEPELQAVATQLVVASRQSRRTKLGILDQFLVYGAPLARLAACEAMGGIGIPEATRRLEDLLVDSDPHLVATAAKALRRHGRTEAVETLSSLLGHQDQQVRTMAQSGLRDFTFLRYVGQFDNLDSTMRTTLGRIVRESDPSAAEQLQREIASATLSRKLRGLQMAEAMDLVGELAEDVIKQAGHQDAAVRSEAVRVLASASVEAAYVAIQKATHDTNALVRNRATTALREFQGKVPSSGGDE